MVPVAGMTTRFSPGGELAAAWKVTGVVLLTSSRTSGEVREPISSGATGVPAVTLTTATAYCGEFRACGSAISSNTYFAPVEAVAPSASVRSKPEGPPTVAAPVVCESCTTPSPRSTRALQFTVLPGSPRFSTRMACVCDDPWFCRAGK